MARKTFLNGYPLPASDLNTYLMDQTVQTFADAAARTAALATPTEGMQSYLADTNTVYSYDGANWVAQIDAANYGTVLPNNSKNAVLNSDFSIWQRGTSIATGTNRVYTADRWNAWRGGLVAGMTVSRQASTRTGGQYAARVQRDSGNTSTQQLRFAQDFESVNSIPFAGKTVTFSIYARAGANYSATSSALGIQVLSGTGTDQNIVNGYTGASSFISSSMTLTTTLQRFTFTGTVPSNATQIGFVINFDPIGTAGANDWYEIEAVQLEAGSVATPFQRANGTIAGELAACQRYYQRFDGANGAQALGTGVVNTTTRTNAVPIRSSVTMRTAPTAAYAGTVSIYDGVFSVSITSIAFTIAGNNGVQLDLGHSSTLTVGRPGIVAVGNGAGNWLELVAEL